MFPASFDLQAAEAVGDDEGELDVVDVVVRLVDRSLVQYDNSTGRYRLLETLRQYAADRLGDAGQTVGARERHARHFLELAVRIGPATEDERYDAAQAALTTELENLRAAAEWCIDAGQWADLGAVALSVR